MWDLTHGPSLLTLCLCRQNKVLTAEVGVWHPGQCDPWDGDLICASCWINAWSCFAYGLHSVFPIITCAQPCSYERVYKPEHLNYAINFQLSSRLVWWLCLLPPLLSGLGLRSKAGIWHDSLPLLLCSNRCVLCFCYGALLLEYQCGFQVRISSCHFLLQFCSHEALFWAILHASCPLDRLCSSPQAQLHSKACPLAFFGKGVPPSLALDPTYPFAPLPSGGFVHISSHTGCCWGCRGEPFLQSRSRAMY